MGGWVSGGAAVVNVQVNGAASAIPSLAFAPVDTVAVYAVDPVRDAEGTRVAVAVVELYETLAATGPAVEESVTVDAPMVVASIARENTAVG